MTVAPVGAFPTTVIFAGQTIAGACVSLTVTVKVHVAFGLLGDVSEAVQVTVVVPTGKKLPVFGEHDTVAPGQLSVAVGTA